MSDTSSKPVSLTTIIAALVGFAVFLLILFLAYLPKRPEPITQGSLSPMERRQKLIEMRAAEHKAATSYAWIDQGKGVVQLPLDRAMELTVQELNARTKK